MFIPLCVPLHKLETDWDASCAEVILRRCPVCERDSIIGHGRRRKQAHDEHHDRIGIRRGRCPGCGKTFTFLPLLSLPYTQYSLLVRCRALRRRFVEQHCSWEEVTPALKDANRTHFITAGKPCARDVSPDVTKRHFPPSSRPPLQSAHQNPQ